MINVNKTSFRNKKYCEAIVYGKRISLTSLITLLTVAITGCGGGGGGGKSPPANPSYSSFAYSSSPNSSAASSSAIDVVARGPSNSGPVQISPDDKFIYVANPDVNTVSVVEVGADKNEKIREINVGIEPRNLAVSPDGKRLYVANAGEETVTVIDAVTYAVLATITVGTEPYGLAFTPKGRKLYVANARSNSVSVIDPATNQVTKTITNVGLEPRGIAITNNLNVQDNDEKVYVTQFLGQDRAGVFDGSIIIGADDYKEGRVAVISTADDSVIKQAVLTPLADTGFKSQGSALKKIPASTNTTTGAAIFDVVTAASPNMLQSVVIKGNRAYLPNTCASADGPVRFNVNMQSCLSVLDTTTDTQGETGVAPARVTQTLNMNRGINFEVADPGNELKRLFLAVPWAVAFKNNSNEGFAVSLSSNVIVKVVLDADGTPTINAPTATGQAGNIVRILVGQGPRGIVINGTDTRAYVANENSRDLSVIDLATNAVIKTVATAALPAAGTDAARTLIGKAIFDSSTGVDLPALTSGGLSGVVQRFPARLSNEGWGSCIACHGFGKTDGIVWIFAAGPRRSSPLNWSFNPKDIADIKVLNHSGVNDEVQDFENNIRDVSGGLGLIDAALPSPKPPLNVINAGRSPQLDALAFYVATGIKTPSSPFAKFASAPTTIQGALIQSGRQVFADANCAACHGGGGWASGRLIRAGETNTVGADATVPVITNVLRNVGTFDVNAKNEIKQNGTVAAGALGYNPPSLLGVGSLAPYLHNGSAQTLEDVMKLVPHRTAGLALGASDPFLDSQKAASVVAFLNSIDATTEPFPIAPLP